MHSEWYRSNPHVISGYCLDFVFPFGIYGDDSAKNKESRLKFLDKSLIDINVVVVI